MAQLSPAQKIYTAVLLTAVSIWLVLVIGVPAYEYSYGQSALTGLLEQIKSVVMYVVLGIGSLAWLLQRIGVLPVVQPDPVMIAAMGKPVSPFKNFALWAVIAILLVFLFNLFQGSKNGSNDQMISLFIMYFPIALIVGVGIFFMMRMNAKKKKDLEGGNSP